MKLYNTLNRKIEDFKPNDPTEVKVYVCGVTPYSSTHVGHALSYVVFDVLRRYLEYSGFNVHHVQNFTDVDDKIILKAQEEGISEDELTERYIQDFFATMDALNVLRATKYPRATQEIPDIIETINTLISNGYAYAAGSDVFFRVNESTNYGELSNRSTDDMISGSRIDIDPNKENPIDFALWKGSKEGEPSWDSPWGPGRPGWHIECTTMSTKYLGEQLDIHGGGMDLVFPHHENEIAQSEAYTSKQPFSKIWMHNGLLQFGQDKMSKSIGNLVSVEEALTKHQPDALRLYLLSSHYRSPLNYSDEGCEAVSRSLQRLRIALEPTTASGTDLDASEYRTKFLSHMNNDLDTPQSIAVMFDLAREINRAKESGLEVENAQYELKTMGSILGITFSAPETKTLSDVAPFVDLLLEIREDLREANQYNLADKIRNSLQDLNINIEDTSAGPKWQ